MQLIVAKMQFTLWRCFNKSQLRRQSWSRIIYWGNTAQRCENVECWINFSLLWNNNSTDTQQMDMIVRYWSCTRKKVTDHCLCSIFFGHAFTVTVADKILEVLDKRSLPLNILLSVSYDGPNVNKFIDAKLSKVLSEAELPVLIDIGSCTLPMVHNT